MNFGFGSVMVFIICQVCTILAQQQGTNPTEALTPSNWINSMYAAIAESWRDYFIRSQQATNQLYQQWANMTGNPLSNAMGGLGGLYGIGKNAQPGSSNQPPRPLRAIFNPIAQQSGPQLSKLTPMNEEPGKRDEKLRAPLRDEIQGTRPQAGVQQQAVPLKLQAQTQPQTQNQGKPSQMIQPPVQQRPSVQPQVATAQAFQPLPLQQNRVPSRIPGVPLQSFGQPASPVGVFGSSGPHGWIR